jgi:thymidylate synthase
MQQYIALMKEIMREGTMSTNRTGVDDKSLFGKMYEVFLDQQPNGEIEGFPLLTTKKVWLKNIFVELKWKLSGSTNIRPLVMQNCNIWTEWPFNKWLKETDQKIEQFTNEEQTIETDEWKAAIKHYTATLIEDEGFAAEFGDLGITYGHNFRNFGGDDVVSGQDQVAEALHRIKNKSDDRRIIISLWNPTEERNTLLPPCPCFYQFNARVPGKLDLNLYQRSCDYFLGVPYNTAQDAMLLCLMAHVTGREPNKFTHMFGDVHIYHNHLEQCAIQTERRPHLLPSVRINSEKTDLFEIEWSDITVSNYVSHEKLTGKVAV